MTVTAVRQPAVAGLFYPADAQSLRAQLAPLLHQPSLTATPKALIVPHAGYVYSAAVAAAAYRCIERLRGDISRVVLLGPSHHVGFHGIAVPAATAFLTPLGQLNVDQSALTDIAALPGVVTLDAAHVQEHCLEVQLPFLQMTLGTVGIVPLVVGDASPAEVGGVLDRLWGGEETLIVISSDLSHYHPDRIACAMDAQTSQAIERLDYAAIGPADACGCRAIAGLLWLARHRKLRAQTLSLTNSGHTGGPRERVVGYGAYVFHES